MSTTTGRTPWDALVDMGGMLGRYTPWIIILAGAVFGGLKINEATRAANAAAKGDVDAAQKSLRDTYTNIGQMHAQQLANLKAMLEVNKATAADTAEKVKDAEHAKKASDSAKAEAAAANNEADEKKKEAMLAKAEAASAKQEAEEEKTKATMAKAENASLLEEAERAQKALAEQKLELDDKERVFNQTQGQHADSQREAARQAHAVSQRAEHITELKDKLIDIANQVKGSKDSSVATLGRKILEEASRDAENLLAAYSKEPGKETSEPLSDLVGSNEDVLDRILPKGLGFTFWQKYSNAAETRGAYIGVVHQTDDTDEDVVLISVAEKKVSDVDVFRRAVSVAGWDPYNWNRAVAYNLYLRPNNDPGVDRFTPTADHWTAPDTVTAFPNGAKKIYGTEKSLPYMGLDDFKKKHADIFKAANESNKEDFSDMVAMLENEKGFAANTVAEPFAREMPKGIRDTFVPLLSESVKRASVKSVKIPPASERHPDVCGEIAAVALKKDFRIEGVQPIQAASVSSAKGETCSIVCAYITFGNPPQHARLTFSREGSDGKWMLQDFENPIYLPSAPSDK